MLIVDENLSRRLCPMLSNAFGFMVTHVVEYGLQHSDDKDIWSLGRQQNMAILTKDNDYRSLSVINGCPPKVIHLRCGNKTTSFIINIITGNSISIKSFLASEDCYLEIG